MKRVPIVLPVETYEWLVSESERTGLSVQAIIVAIIRKKLNEGDEDDRG